MNYGEQYSRTCLYDRHVHFFVACVSVILMADIYCVLFSLLLNRFGRDDALAIMGNDNGS